MLSIVPFVMQSRLLNLNNRKWRETNSDNYCEKIRKIGRFFFQLLIGWQLEKAHFFTKKIALFELKVFTKDWPRCCVDSSKLAPSIHLLPILLCFIINSSLFREFFKGGTTVLHLILARSRHLTFDLVDEITKSILKTIRWSGICNLRVWDVGSQPMRRVDMGQFATTIASISSWGELLHTHPYTRFIVLTVNQVNELVRCLSGWMGEWEATTDALVPALLESVISHTPWTAELCFSFTFKEWQA